MNYLQQRRRPGSDRIEQVFPHGYRGRVNHWRITKYNPRFRHERGGYYLRDEWTSRSEIGKTFVDGVLTESEYRRVEGLYASAARLLWMASGQPPLQIQALEPNRPPPTQSDPLGDVGFAGWRPVNGEFVPGEHFLVAAIVRWCLRELGWCLLVAPGFYVQFGDDFYMYAGTTDSLQNVRRAIASSGLFVEPTHPHGPKLTPKKFCIGAWRVSDNRHDHDHELTLLSDQASADLWPEITALAGYLIREIDGPMAERINRYARFDFDFERFTYCLTVDDD
jgi:hypothetical protein